MYLDDILIASMTFHEHIQHIREVFARLRTAGLRLKPRKCLFLHDEVPYLGHLISAQGLQPDPSKTEKVRICSTPHDVTTVHQFIGLTYCWRFVPNFSSIASPLCALTKKNVTFQWTDECQTAFDYLKRMLTTAPILLAYPNFGPDAEFVLETDASGAGLGAIPSQQQGDGMLHPIAYASRSLDPSERNYGITELETLTVVWAAHYFRPYLLGHRTIVYTDHSACVSVLSST